MPYYRVQPSDHLWFIAAQHGLPFDKVWEAPENEDLRGQDVNPDVLQPGTDVYVPEPQAKSEAGATGQRHRFRLTRETLWLSLNIGDLLPAGAKKQSCRLHHDHQVTSSIVPQDGVVDFEVSPTLREATLEIDGQRIQLRIGALDPASTPSGLRARLENLGYYDDVDEEECDDTDVLTEMIERFQEDQDLPITGEMDEVTSQALVDVHGS